MRGVELVACLYVVLFLAGLYITYWIIRLAVRHGIADADQRRRAHFVLEQYQQRQQHDD